MPGDRARHLEDGSIELLGRDSVTINSGGEKIFAEEVEMAIASHPAVADVVVAGRPSERWGHEVVAVVALADGASADAQELIEHAGQSIARYKLPKAIVFRASSNGARPARPTTGGPANRRPPLNRRLRRRPLNRRAAARSTGSSRLPCRAPRRAGRSRPEAARRPGGRQPVPRSWRTSSCICRSPDAPIGSPLAISPPSVLIGIGPAISVPPSASIFSCSPSAQKPHSAMWITSAPASVSCSWMTSTSTGPTPAFSNAALGA